MSVDRSSGLPDLFWIPSLFYRIPQPDTVIFILYDGQQLPVCIGHNVVAFGYAFSGKAFPAVSIRMGGCKFPGLCHLQLCRYASAQCRRNFQFFQQRIILIGTMDLFRHGTVDTSIDGHHHVAYDIWFFHRHCLSSFITFSLSNNDKPEKCLEQISSDTEREYQFQA